MSHALPRLRLASLDFMPSQDPERPGLVIRDRYQFSDMMLLIPPPLVECLECFDGEQTELDLRASLVRATGEIQIGELEKNLCEALSSAGFLDDENFANLRDARVREFAAAPERLPHHAGAAYPDQPGEVRELLDQYMNGAPSYADDRLLGIAAPHVSPHGGWESYRDAYAALKPALKDKTFIVLGTSHYGAPDYFGLTRKPYRTPFGAAMTDTSIVDELESKAPGGVVMEDYFHSVEHSIEFQVLFLQHVLGPDIRIVPILCGSFARSILYGGKPEANENVKRFLGTLGEIGEREQERLFWVLGIDMAHMGRHYGDDLTARADQGEMLQVADRDRSRIDQVCQSNAQGFWERIQENQDDLKWCGSSPLYTFLNAVSGARGNLRRYQQWNIDQQSVVSFAAMTFHHR